MPFVRIGAISPEAKERKMRIRLPWRLKWAITTLVQKRFWRILFDLTRTMPRAQVIFLVLRVLLHPTKTMAASGRPIAKLAIDDLGVLPIDNFSDFYHFYEIFLNTCYDLDIKSSSPSIVDIGANVGLFAFRMKQLYPAARIWCFEPLDDNSKRLDRNIHILKLKGIHSYRCGVSDTSGEMPLFVHPTNTGGHTIVKSLADPQSKEHFIKVISMSKIFEIVSASQIDLLKLDCEGAEELIILSLKREDAVRIKTIIYEQHGKRYMSSMLTSHLESIGFECCRKGCLTIASRQEAFWNC
jgi:FkbM family methyltransferase